MNFIGHAQYFGRNKPKYQEQKFKVLETDNFEIYHYLDSNRELLDRLALNAEKWYHMHLEVLKVPIPTKNPLIFYNNHADFQQTNTIFGSVGVGTGGVTEGLKNRVIMPVAFTNQQTNHVLGHEMVHAFQFNSILNGDSTSINNLQNIPLWFIEGMAEYLSLGRVDQHTAMWMRDAVLNDDIPAISDLINYQKYFPYRFGQAFLAFLSGVYGDDIIYPFMQRTALVGMEQACIELTGTNLKTLSDLWVKTIREGFTPYKDGRNTKAVGRSLLEDDLQTKINLSPAISPNGQFVIYLSEKSIFSLDLFLADARTGKIIRKITSHERNNDIDDLNLIESSGTWSPDSREFAYVAFKGGRNVLVITDVNRPRNGRTIKIPNLQSFTNPAWSPDGKTILVSGSKNGQTDLYLYNLQSKKVKQLTNNPYSEIHPSWSPEGNLIVYSTDEYSWIKNRPTGQYTFNLALIDPLGDKNTVLDIFSGANNLNPLLDSEGNIYFLSDRDGFRNLYRFNTGNENLEQLTNFYTGISGLTPFSPAITMSGSRSKPRIIYTYFSNRSYTLHAQMADAFDAKAVGRNELNMEAATLPPPIQGKANIVDKNLETFPSLNYGKTTQLEDQPYKSRFILDHVGGGTGMGMNTSNSFGANTAMVGGLEMLFSDILGDQLLFAGVSMNGEIYDAGGMVQYLNRKKRISWGLGFSHIPFRSGAVADRGLVLLEDNVGNRIPVYHYDLYVNRIFQDQFNVMLQYPFSITRRVEFGSGYAMFYERRDLISNYYNEIGQLVHQDRSRIPSPGRLNMFFNNAAYVGDNSVFGMASPMSGGRYRVAGELYWGDFQYQTALFDFRKYHFLKPINFSYRLLQYNRFGRDSERLFRLFSIDPMLVRGYSRYTIDDFRIRHGLEMDQISGSKMLIGNLELRLPFTGIPKLALIPSRFLFTEFALFLDAGMTWTHFNDFRSEQLSKPVVLASTGISLRINLFGSLIIEPFYAFPIVDGKIFKGNFGFNFIPGW